jgi:hypothetical protein
VKINTEFFLIAAFLFLSCNHEVSFFPEDIHKKIGGWANNIDIKKHKNEVVATVNGEHIYLDELEEEIKTGRFGGSKELLLDELISFKAVLQERDRMQGKACRMPKNLRDEAISFLNLLFSKEIICRDFKEQRLYRMYEGMKGRKIPFYADYNDPGVKMEINDLVCQAEMKKMINQYLSDLRKSTRIEINRKILDSI